MMPATRASTRCSQTTSPPLCDRLFRRTTRGRLIVSIVGVIAGTVLFFITMNVPVTAKTTFLVMLAAVALFTPSASPNVVSTICDVTLPEVRSASVAIESFVESVGAALSPLIAGLIAVGRLRFAVGGRHHPRAARHRGHPR